MGEVALVLLKKHHEEEMKKLSKYGAKMNAQDKLTLLEQATDECGVKASVCSLVAAPGVVKCVILGICLSVVCLFMRLYPLLIPNPRLVQNHPFSHPAAASTSERH